MTLNRFATDLIATTWRDDLIPQLCQYIEIPALSPAFDPDWATSGHIEDAVAHVREWMAARPLEGMTVQVQRLEGRTPLIVAEVEPYGPDGRDGPAVLLYGHLDKQPEMEGWRDGLGPWKPVLDGDRLYGRGGADDGYAAYASMTALEAVQRSGGSHGRCVVLIEASEESGSPDLPAHVSELTDRLGDVDLVICLDSGCATYDTLWLTTSLRGLVDGTLTVTILTEGVHSGGASGPVPSSFRIMRQLLDRIEDAATGAVLVPEATVAIPDHRVDEAAAMAALLGGGDEGAGERFPLVPGARTTCDGAEALLASTWKPTVSYVGADGLPPTAKAGNVLRPMTAIKISLRLPPTADPAAAQIALRARLTDDPPYGATVTFGRSEAAPGWNAPALEPWLRAALDEASASVFGGPVQLMGEGGTIPFMGMLGDRFPAAQFVITGVLGPGSNAHGPNEFLHLAYAEQLTSVIANTLDAHASRQRGA
ncbi:MAG: M20/M25/M40 family metallo-hydrolase [Acidimicrobiia bacterium]|nr:M20/M25/M40 family metallo-hydrolase [Acidimicrobiia bacterium]